MDMDQKRAYWQGLIDQQSASGQSIRAWCDANGIKQWQYYAWKARLRPESAAACSDAFIALELPENGKLSVSFGRDVRIDVDGQCSLTHLRIALEVLCGSRRCWR